MTSIRMQYETLYDNYLVELAQKLEAHVLKSVHGVQFIDRVSARAKTVLSFCKKAQKQDLSGANKYTDPFEQIEDMIGVRIIMFYPQTQLFLDERVNQFYTRYEEVEKHPESDMEFGYEGKHYVLRVPSELLPDEIPINLPDRFELQIKTLYQHAFSEATHDLIFKPNTNITPDQKKRAAFAAASSWGADEILKQLLEEIRPDYLSSE